MARSWRNRIWKYPLPFDEDYRCTIKVPPGKIRHVGMQGDVVCLWLEWEGPIYEPDPRKLAKVPKTFALVATGEATDFEGTYLSTVFEGSYVWHIYQVRE